MTNFLHTYTSHHRAI